MNKNKFAEAELNKNVKAFDISTHSLAVGITIY